MTRSFPVAGLLLASVLLAGLPGCKKQPAGTNAATTRVSVQRPTSRSTDRGDWASTVYPARYADPELPVFPPEGVTAQVAHATVRADFNVLADGLAHDIDLELVAPVPEGDRFIAACAAALERWRFSPAWRLARDGERDTAAVVLIPSKAHLIFHFDLGAHLEGGAVEMSFGPGGR